MNWIRDLHWSNLCANNNLCDKCDAILILSRCWHEKKRADAWMIDIQTETKQSTLSGFALAGMTLEMTFFVSSKYFK